MDTDLPSTRAAQPGGAARAPSRILLLALAGAALVATWAGVLAAQRGGAARDPATPEGTVAAYLTAVLVGDDDRVRQLAPELRCPVTGADRGQLPDGLRVVLRDTQVTGDTARVEVGVSAPTGEVFGGWLTVDTHAFRLARTGGDWHLTGDPWPMSSCGGTGV